MDMWVVYERPRDYPEGFVARCHRITPGHTWPTPDAVFAKTLEEVRELLPFGLYRLPRNPCDDACIVETWI